MATQTFRPPATQRVYDVCILGSQLGGVVAGALLARRGFRVLHVAHDDPGFHYVDHGYVLPFGPAVVPSPRHLPSAEAVLGELGLATDVGRALVASHTDLQLLLPRHRVDLARDPAVLRGELKREWPAAAEALEAGFAELGTYFDFAGFFLRAAPPLPPDGFGERWTVRKAVKLAASAPGAPPRAVDEARPFEKLQDEELVRSLLVAHRFLTYRDGPPSPMSLVRLLGGAFRGTHRLPGGLGTLREMVRRRIQESRGELRGKPGEPALATGLELDHGRVSAVRLADSPDAHVARAFVAATDAERFLALLPADVRASRQAAGLTKVHSARQLLTLNLVVKERALPPALGENVLALRDAAGGEGIENAVFMQVLPAHHEARKGASDKGTQGEVIADERVVCAAAYVPAGMRPQGLADAAARIREAVADAIPFFERHLVVESAPLLADPERAHMAQAHPLYLCDADDRLGIGGLPVRSPWKNLVFAGREVVPGLGVEGEFYAGIQAAGHVAAMLGAKDGGR
ncbi:MAG: phytoene dehydrogenase [Anaeromyxobacteraceae bacterium]